ncbi:MAG: energy transducer TonB [bacterium]
MKGPLVISAIAHAVLFVAIIVPAYQGRGGETLDVINVSLLGGGGPGPGAQAATKAAPAVKEAETPKETPKETPPTKMDYKPPKKTTPKKDKAPSGSKSGSKPGDAAKSGSGRGGSGTGTGSGVGPGSGIKVDDQDFRFAYYLEVIRERIGYSWSPPALYGAKSDVAATVYFKIGRDGSISDAEIEKSSSQETFDRAALRAIKLADPLPPLPAGFRGKNLGVHFEFQHTPG